MMHYPFQKLCCVQPVDGQQPFLLAASGAVISSFNLKDGSLLSRWPPLANEDEDRIKREGTRPTKRRKIEEGNHAELSRDNLEDSSEDKTERMKSERRKLKIESSKLLNVSHIVTTSDGVNVIAVTGEDKAVGVFNVRAGGILELLNQRFMPKRICAIVLTPDEKSILVGDKFGDVYFLPLHPTEGWAPKKTEQGQKQATYNPSATELTVHTKGNLEALRQQREQKVSQPKKEGPNFECKLLLGHVSLLTDVVITEIQARLKRRQYILTADRDEHIRVSRGVSQAFIIENYCLGHREFVSKLRIVPWNRELLIAGSGEPSLRVYHWPTGRLLDQELFQGAVQKDIRNALYLSENERSLGRLAISNIWPIHYSESEKSPRSHQPARLLLVAFEGIPMILSYMLTENGHLKHHQTITLGGNVLDVGIGPALWEIVVSIDTIHTPGSIKTLRTEDIPPAEAFETFELFSSLSSETNGSSSQKQVVDRPDLNWERTSLAMLLNSASLSCQRIAVASSTSSREGGPYSTLAENLYGLENLRKKRGPNAVEAEEEDVEETAPAEA